MFSKWLLNLVPTVACCLFITAFPCGAGESDIPPDPGTSIDSDLMKEVKRQVTRNPKEREDALDALRKMLDSLQNEREKLLVECAIADVLMDYKFIPGMSKEKLAEIKATSLVEARKKLEYISTAYPEAKTLAYYRYLVMTLRNNHPDENPNVAKNHTAMDYAKDIIKDWNILKSTMKDSPRDLTTQMYWAISEPFEKQATSMLPEELTSDEREIMVAQTTLDLMKENNVPGDIVCFQEREVAVAAAIVKGVDPNKKLSEQIDWPKKETAEATPTQRPTSSESMKKSDTRTYWPYAVAVALALLSLIAYMRYRQKCSRRV